MTRIYTLGFVICMVLLHSAWGHAGERPVTGKKWIDMDYGPFLTTSTSMPKKPKDVVAFKGFHVRLGEQAYKGNDAAMVFDSDLLRMGAGWTGDFLNLIGVSYEGSHNSHCSLNGDTIFRNPLTPGWAKAGSFEDPRDMIWGPLPRDWAHYKGLFVHGDKVVFKYSVGDAIIHEMADATSLGETHVLSRTLLLGKHTGLSMQAMSNPYDTVEARLLSGLGDAAKDSSAEDTILVLKGKTDEPVIALAVQGPKAGSTWNLNDPKQIRLDYAASRKAGTFKVFIWSGSEKYLSQFVEHVQASKVEDVLAYTKGGPTQYPEKITTQVQTREQEGAYVVDFLTPPDENPWNSWIRFGGIDFFEDDSKAALCTWNGDVWTVEGIGSGTLTWQRIATGIFQPLGIKIVDDQIYVCGREQITILHDLNGDGEADYYENFNNDHQVSEHFHEFAFDIQTDDAGDFYYAKGARHAKDALFPQHGTIIKVSRDGETSEILANGFRSINGLGVQRDGEAYLVGDNEGHWVPANRYNWVVKGGFYGNMWSYHQGERPTIDDPPLCWLPNNVDRSPGTFIWVPDERWGPFKNRIITISYGMGYMLHVLKEEVDGVVQGGAVRFPLDFETGVMRAKFRPSDGQLYTAGLFGWAGNKTRPGGFYRIRYTGEAICMPEELHIAKDGLHVTFTEALDRETALDKGNYAIHTWNYRWSENYGSPQLRKNGQEGQDPMKMGEVRLSEDGRTLSFYLPDIEPVMQMRIQLGLKTAAGKKVSREIHNTIHRLGPDVVFKRDPEADAAEAASALEEYGAPGLIQQLRNGTQFDTRLVRMPALQHGAEESPSVNLNPGTYTSTWSGFILSDLNQYTMFSVASDQGTVDVSLMINSEEVLATSMKDGGTAVAEAILLKGGHNSFELTAKVQGNGAANLRLYWESDRHHREPVPPSAFMYLSNDGDLELGLAQRAGQQIIAEKRCLLCHESEAELVKEPYLAKGPSLDNIGARLQPAWLAQWIADPHKMNRQAHMPTLFERKPRRSARGYRAVPAAEAAAHITAYLVNLSDETSPASDISTEAIAQGKVLYEEIGCVACHRLPGAALFNEGDERLELQVARTKWQPGALAMYLAEPHAHYVNNPMPKMGLSEEEAQVIAAYLMSLGESSQASFKAGDPEAGRELLEESGCLQCHDLSGHKSAFEEPELEEFYGEALNFGCLAKGRATREAAPEFNLTRIEQESLKALLNTAPDALRRYNSVDYAEQQIAALNCLQCHSRDGTGNFWATLEDTQAAANLSEDAFWENETEDTIHNQRPPLDWAGEKLHSAWTEALLEGALPYRTRPHLKARMPQYPQQAAGIAAGLAAQHGFAPSSAEDSVKPDAEKAAVGRELARAEDKLNCFSCHNIGPEMALSGQDTETINFTHIADRLRYHFFDRFVKDPLRLLSGTKMPQFVDENGKTAITDVYEGDAQKQYDAIWHYIHSVEE